MGRMGMKRIFLGLGVLLVVGLVAFQAGAAFSTLYVNEGIRISASSSTPCPSGKACVWVSSGDGKIHFHDASNVDIALGTTVLTTSRVSDTTIVANTLVKGATTAGRVQQFLASDSPVLVTGVALQVAGGSGITINVQEIQGVQVPIKSDGTTIIAPGDLVEPSTITDGRIRKGNINPIGTAMSAAAAVADALVDVL